ncbi:hypothetical protein llap_13656 [Limosa lapponica baueri]|uniref:URB1 N-terminal domain-containing protein n=1 Tax=Limosa lapponica baueri TaxID=1758121 RepID=A0A2I0TQF7_LIMLA|nr:hypothetical protein llap_13656 [Limosa lapponica baueri]
MYTMSWKDTSKFPWSALKYSNSWMEKGSMKVKMSRVCLTLLSAMVAQGPDSARDVYSHFDFNNKFLPGLLKKRCKKGRADVRMAYIQFALSFLIAGDNAILTQVLELKDFIPNILRSEIKEDKVSTVNLLLSTLRTKVVQNKSITKTQKVRFFTAEVLIHIASLYRWNGITDVSPEDLEPRGFEIAPTYSNLDELKRDLLRLRKKKPDLLLLLTEEEGLFPLPDYQNCSADLLTREKWDFWV